jgi:hypothetical protein
MVGLEVLVVVEVRLIQAVFIIVLAELAISPPSALLKETMVETQPITAAAVEAVLVLLEEQVRE